MNATQLSPRRNPARQPRPTATRPVPQLLLEIAYQLHATRGVARPSDRRDSPQNHPASHARR